LGADNPTQEKTLVTKSEEAIAGYFSWQKVLRKARAHVRLSMMMMSAKCDEQIIPTRAVSYC
jgi:hypothetical protein